tara:strand:+ start:2807 stop:3070 length:264 start_codon:yes stop_codon:yes gene_type:complete
MKLTTGLGLASAITIGTIVTVNVGAENPDLSSIEQSTSIQYQVPENASQSQKDCYKIMTDVSLSQFSALKSEEEGHKRAMKSCGIKP